jgi:hypothetical protein
MVKGSPVREHGGDVGVVGAVEQGADGLGEFGHGPLLRVRIRTVTVAVFKDQ